MAGPDRTPPAGYPRSERSGRFKIADPPRRRPLEADIDGPRVVRTFAPALTSPDAATEYMFAQLFVRNPELRSLFPLSMKQTRARTVRTLAGLVRDLVTPAGCEPALRDLAQKLRRHGIKPVHYALFGQALIASLEHLNGPAWTPRDDESWQVFIEHAGSIMRSAAAEDEKRQPAWWVGEIVQHEQRTPGIAVITIRPDQPLSYRAGQYLGLQVPRWPRLWRDYSVANAPRENGLLDLHVRAVPGGLISNALVSHCGPGDTVVLSAARGDLAVSEDRDLVCVAGGTGLAPIKALIEQAVGTASGRRRNITLYLGARQDDDFYDTRDLDVLALAYPALTVVRVLGESGAALIRTVAGRHPSFRDTDVCLAGPVPMIAALRQALASRVPADRLHHDSLDALRAASSA